MSQIVEITQPGHWLGKTRGFLEVRKDGAKLGQVPLDDLTAVIISVQGCSFSTNLADHLAQRNIPLVLCGENYLPTSLILPVQGHNRQFQIMQAQNKLSEPKRKRAWQQIVKSKIKNQADVLARAGQSHNQLLKLISKVRSGDPQNCEAQAARFYWQRLFGNEFRRDRTRPGINAALNYTYTILRACIARGVSSAGLHPSVSVQHKNPQNPLNLVDDLVEPFRPIADYILWSRKDQLSKELDAESKSDLASITVLTVPLGEETPPLSLAAAKMCKSFSDYCLGEADTFLVPTLPSPLEIGEWI